MSLLRKLCYLSYTMLKPLPPLISPDYVLVLKRAWPEVNPEEYGRVPYFLALIGFMLGASATPLVGTAALALAALGALIGVLVGVFAPLVAASSAASYIDVRLAGLAGFMAALSLSTPMVDELLLAAASVEKRGSPLHKLLTIALYKISVLRKNVPEALTETARLSPSLRFSLLLTGLAQTLATRGDVSQYLAKQFEELIAEKTRRVERLLVPLTYLAEVYIIASMLGPLVFLLAAIVGAALGGTVIDPRLFMLLLTFVFIPIGTLALGALASRGISEVETL